MIYSVLHLYSPLYDIMATMSHHTRWGIDRELCLPELCCSHILICSIEEQGLSIYLMDLAICRISQETDEFIDMDAFGFSLHGYRIELANSEYISYLIIRTTRDNHMDTILLTHRLKSGC